MKNKNSNNKNQIEQSGNHFLKEAIHKKDLAQEHKEYLGMDVPDDYFSKSKNNILNSLPMETKRKQTVFGLNRFIAYPLAASILVLISIAIWLQNETSQIDRPLTNVETINAIDVNSEDFLVSSLLIEDEKLDQFMNEFIVEEILVEAELSEQQFENIFINSLFIEDSLINSFIDKNLIENVVL